MALAGISLVGAGEDSLGTRHVRRVSSSRGVLPAGFAVLTAALVMLGLALWTLMQRYGSVLLRLEALEERNGVAPLKTAPDFQPTRPGRSRGQPGRRPRRRAPRAAGLRQSYVSQLQRGCCPLASWQADPEHPFSVVVISDGDVAENRDKLAGTGPLRILLQDDRSTATAYAIQGTPGAVVVGTDGLLGGAPMHGVNGVRNLHESVRDLMTGGGAESPTEAQALHQIESRPTSTGDPLPEVTLISEDGVEATSAAAIGEDAVLLFWRTDCGFCQQILEDVRALEASVPVRLVTGSDLLAVRSTGLMSPVLRDPQGALERWLQVPGTPSAARVRGGVLSSAVVVGGPDVLFLLRSMPAVGVDVPI